MRQLPDFTFRINETNNFINAIKLISDIVTETTLRIDKGTLRITAMDPANVCMCDLTTPITTKSKPCSVSINLNDLKQVLKRAAPGDSIIFTNLLRRTLVELNGSTHREFYLAAPDIDERQQKTPNLTMQATVSINSEQLWKEIQDCDLFGESATLTTDNGAWYISANIQSPDDSVGSYKVANRNPNVPTSTKLRGKYGIEYLKRMTCPPHLGSNAVIEWGTDYPLRITYNNKKTTLVFILAPRVDNP